MAESSLYIYIYIYAWVCVSGQFYITWLTETTFTNSPSVLRNSLSVIITSWDSSLDVLPVVFYKRQKSVKCVYKRQESVMCVYKRQESVKCVYKRQESVMCVYKRQGSVMCVYKRQESVMCVYKRQESVFIAENRISKACSNLDWGSSYSLWHERHESNFFVLCLITWPRYNQDFFSKLFCS